MTNTDLVESVAAWLREQTSEMRFYCQRQTKEEAPDGWKGIDVHAFSLARSAEARKKAPYIIVQPVHGTDEHAPGQEIQARTVLRFVLAVYNPGDDEQEGARVLMELIDRIRIALDRRVVVSDHKTKKPLFWVDLTDPPSWDFYHEQTQPFSVGWIESTWAIPAVKREVAEWL